MKVINAIHKKVSTVSKKGTFDIKYTDEGNVITSNFSCTKISTDASKLPKSIPIIPRKAPWIRKIEMIW